ncbi:MAG: MBL fold metallo-hydrolase [Chloroflexi bacterium]|nr:MBL fold metallo-hydrolase [Chloroflexota bacterium]
MIDDLAIVRLRHGPFWNFSYIVGSRQAGVGLVIDPAWDVGAIRARASEAGLRIAGAVATHGHHDHVHGLEELISATGAPVYVHHADAPDLRASFAGPITEVDHRFTLDLGGHTITFLHTPGHSPGSQSILVGTALFTGDTIMVGSIGRWGAAAGAPESMWRSVRTVIGSLPDDTVIYPGHDYGRRPTSMLGEERRANPGFVAADIETFRGLGVRA